MRSAPGTTLDRTRPPGRGPTREFHFPPVERRVLSNGLRLLVSPVRAFPVATLTLVLPAGGEAEPAARAGLGTLVPALLESGTTTRSAAEIAEAVEGMGVSVHAAARWDWAEVGITGLTARLRPSVEILADLVRHPSFPPDEVVRLRAERLAEIAQTRADPGGLASEWILRAIFAPESPYHRPLDGTPETVTGITQGDVVALHSARYRPEGATLIVVGDVDMTAAEGLANEWFGEWSGAADPLPPLRLEARSPKGRIVIVDRPGAAQSEVRVGHVGVARENPDFFPLLVMNAILGGFFSSRLNLNLRERHGYTYGVSSQWAMRRQGGPFTIATAVQTERTGAAVREILHEVRRMRDEPVSEGELADARSYLAGVFPLGLQTTDGIAARLVTLAAYGLEEDYFDRYRERILAVSAVQVQRVAREHLHPDRLDVVVVGEAAATRPELEALRHGPVEVVAAGEP